MSTFYNFYKSDKEKPDETKEIKRPNSRGRKDK